MPSALPRIRTKTSLGMSLSRAGLKETTVRVWAEIPGEYHPLGLGGEDAILRRHFEVTVYGPRYAGHGGELTMSAVNWSAYGSTDLPRAYLFLRVMKKALAIAAKLQREAES